MAGIRSVRRGSDGKPAAARPVTGRTTLDSAIFGSLKQTHDRKPHRVSLAGCLNSVRLDQKGSLRVDMFTYICSRIYLLAVYTSKRIHIDIRQCLRGLNAIRARDLSLSV